MAQLDPRKAGLAQGPPRELRPSQGLAEGAPFVRLLCLTAAEAMLGSHQRWDTVGKCGWFNTESL